MKTQKAIRTVREQRIGDHDLSELNAALADGWLVSQMTSDGQSAIVYVLEKGQDDPPAQP